MNTYSDDSIQRFDSTTQSNDSSVYSTIQFNSKIQFSLTVQFNSTIAGICGARCVCGTVPCSWIPAELTTLLKRKSPSFFIPMGNQLFRRPQLKQSYNNQTNMDSILYV